MSVRRLHGAEGADDEALAPLVARYAFKPYRNFRVFSRATETRVLLAELTASIADRVAEGAVAEHGDDRALVVWRRLAWDTNFFGVSMARIDHLLGASRDGRAAPDALDACLAECRAAGVQHVAARIDAADIAAVGLLESRGFRLMDGLVTYIWRPGRETALPRVRDRGRIRPMAAADAEPLLDMAADAYRQFRGRFHMDPHLAPERADAFYVEWARQCVSGRMADTVLVSERADGTPIGFLAFRRREPVSTVTGTPIFGAGLGACRRDAQGAYAGLIRAGTRWAHERGGIAECQTQTANFPTVRVYEAVGARYVRAEHTLHAWLPGA